MKKSIYGITIVSTILLCICFLSCNDEKQTINEPDSVHKIIDIGIAHNKGLASMLTKLEALPKTRSGEVDVSDEEIEDLALETAMEIVDECEIEDEYKTAIYEYLDEMVENQTFDDVELTYGELPSTLEPLTRELDLVFTDDDDDLTSLLNRVAQIETTAKSTLTGQDLETMLTACCVTSYTLQYWNDYALSWVELSQSSSTRASFSWKSLGRADLQGCVAAVGGGVATVLIKCGPVGWKAWAAIAIGGAVSGSIINAWDQLCPEDTNTEQTTQP
ncbi:MAG: hypothetical protein IJ477_05555 [Alistipes sp.]|nr:hypothetical protein [Alistipes sp.]